MFFYYYFIFCFKDTVHTGTQFNWNYFECEDSLISLILTVDIVISREPLRETQYILVWSSQWRDQPRYVAHLAPRDHNEVERGLSISHTFSHCLFKSRGELGRLELAIIVLGTRTKELSYPPSQTFSQNQSSRAHRIAIPSI